MTKKSQVLNMSLLPVILLLVLIVGAGYFLMAGDVNVSKLFNREPQVRRLQGFPTAVPTSEIFEKKRVVIKSEAELATFLNAIDKTGLLGLSEKVNFDKEYLIGITGKTLPKTTSTIKIRKLYEDKEDSSLIVSIKQIDLGDACEADVQSNLPVDLVAISKTDLRIVFDIVKETKECTQN